MTDNVHQQQAGLTKEDFKAKLRAQGITLKDRRELTATQREVARRERSRVASQIADIERRQHLPDPREIEPRRPRSRR